MSFSAIDIDISEGKRCYFVSDFHLGIPDEASSLIREKKIVAWLTEIAPHTAHLFLLGDLFDTWMEYKKVIPKGYVRLLGKLAELSDLGIHIHIFTGNHDLWMHGYFEQQFGAKVYKQPMLFTISGKKILVGHGDGVCDMEKRYIRMKKIFHHPLSQWIYRQLHPDVGLRIADYISRKGIKHRNEEEALKPDNEEFQIMFVNSLPEGSLPEVVIFGHRHIPMDKILQNGVRFINTGDWIRHFTYVVIEKSDISLKKY